MAEINVKVDIPLEFKKEFEVALAKALKNFILDLEFAIADEIASKSQLTDEQVDRLADGLKKRVAKRHFQ